MLALGFISACSDKVEEVNNQETQANVSIPEYDKITFSYKKGELKVGCDVDSQMVCAIDLLAKCTINPNWPECNKELMPSFVFMEDESLKRPTEVSFRIYKLKPLGEGIVEAYTDSSCNGGWFGLCQGNVIYVLSPHGKTWKVNDVYSLAQ